MNDHGPYETLGMRLAAQTFTKLSRKGPRKSGLHLSEAALATLLAEAAREGAMLERAQREATLDAARRGEI